MSLGMTVAEFWEKYECCPKGIEDGRGYETMREWWNKTQNAHFMRWCIEAENDGLIQLCREAFIKVDHPKILQSEVDPGKFIIHVLVGDADFMREYVKCPW